MCWLCSPGQSRELFWNSVCHTEPQHILSIYPYRCPEVEKNLRHQRGPHPGPPPGEFDLGAGPAGSFCSAAASPVLCSAFLVCLKCLAFPAFSSTCENPVEIILNGPWTDQGPARLRCPQLLCSNLLAICRVMFSSLFPSSGSLPDEKWPKTVIN